MSLDGRSSRENSRSEDCSALLSFRSIPGAHSETARSCDPSARRLKPGAVILEVPAVNQPQSTFAFLAGLLLLGGVAAADPGPILPPPDRPSLPGRPDPAPPASLPAPRLPPAPVPSVPQAPSLPPVLPPIGRPLAVPDPEPPSYAAWEEILKGLAVSLIPQDYENIKDWGKQNRVFDGINADVRNGNLRLAKRTAMVNHGLWRRYRVKLIEPERTVLVTIHDRGHRDARQHLLISAQFEAFVDARMELWTMGVKGLNGSVHGTGTMRIDVALNYAVETEFKGALPELRLVPQVDGLNLTLVEYRARKIGPLRGDLAEAVGDGGRAVLREIVNGQEEKLLKKLRTEVASKQDRLRLAPGDWLFSGSTK